MMSQLRTSYVINARRSPSEQPNQNTALTTNDPIDSVERDDTKDHTAQMGHDSLALYVGCPSRLKLLGLYIGSATPLRTTAQTYPLTEHDDDASP
jgi:hypothetical protein